MSDAEFHTNTLDSDEFTYAVTRELQENSERLARTVEQLEAFQQIALMVGSDASIEAVLRMICSKTTQLMRAEKTTLFLVENDGDNPPTLNSVIAERAGAIRLNFGQGIAGTVARQRQTLNIKDVSKCRIYDPSLDQDRSVKMMSCLCMPIFNIQKELLGVVEVVNKSNGYFTLNDEEMLASICSQIGVSLSQHRFYMSMLHKNSELSDAHEKLQQRTDELDMLYMLEREAAVAPNLKKLAESMLSRSVQAFRVKFAAIYMHVSSEHRLYAAKQTSAKSPPEFIPRLMPKVPAFLSAVIKKHDCVSLSLREIETLPEQTERSFGVALNALLIAPLYHEDSGFGALIIGSQKILPNPFSPSDAKLASLLALHIAPPLAAQFDREANEKKQRLSAIGQMISSLLHDMKTPLANISGYVELMSIQNDQAKRASYAEVVDRQIETLKNMSTEILQFARGESAIILKQTDLNEIIPPSVELLKSEAARRNIAIVIDTRLKGTVYCDDAKIQRLIVNLVRNAMEAIDSNGTITVSTYQIADKAYLAVTDDGPGIPQAIAETLFNPFVTSGKKGGTGLGLAIVKKIVDEHKASITWQPVSPHGTSFIIAFSQGE